MTTHFPTLHRPAPENRKADPRRFTIRNQNAVSTARLFALICFTAAALFIVQAMFSQETSSAADKHFVHAALEGGTTEVKLGQLALQKASSEDVKQFAQKMIDNHGQLGDQMKGVAGKIGVAIPAGMSTMEAAEYKKLSMMSGDSFDKAYIKEMVSAHQSDLKAFQHEASTGTNGSVKDIANSGSQMVQTHLDMIKKIAQEHHIQVQ